MENVILVDQDDQEIGVMEKMEAHEKGLLHRAFSIFLFNDEQELLIHQRALHKYHSGGLWTNTCCSHPRPGESIEAAAHRRLEEEMGIGCEMEKMFSFIYKAPLDNMLTEHELDHVLIGYFSGTPSINKEEVADWKFIETSELEAHMQAHPALYTEWFKIALPIVLQEKNKLALK